MNQPVQQSSDLPELPTQPAIFDIGRFGIAYSADQMRDYARAAIAATQVVADQPSDEQIKAALESARRFIRNGIEFGYVHMPEAETPDPAHNTLPMIEAALSLLASNAGKASSEQTEEARLRELCSHSLSPSATELFIDACTASSEPAVAAIEAVKFPEIPLNDDVKEILGRLCFQCAGIASRLRLLGFPIARKAEDEQAVVLHWLLTIYLKHGDQWRKEGERFLASTPAITPEK